MKFMNMMQKYHTRQEAATPPEGGGGGGLTPPPMQAPAPAAPTQPPAAPPAAQQPAPPAAQPQPAAQPPAAPEQTTFSPITQQQSLQLESYVLAAGLQAEHVAQEMDAYGKLSDVTISILRQKHGEHADLIINSINQEYNTQKQQHEAAKQQTYNEVATLLGVDQSQGAQEFANMVDWFSKSEYAGSGEEMANLIDGGGLGRTLALQALTNNYRASQGAQLVDGEPPAPSSNSHMTIAEYNRQLPELERKHGYDSPQVRALQAQRNAARNAGIN